MRGLAVLCALVGVYLCAPAAGQNPYEPNKGYKNMTFEWDVRHRGGIEIPRCVKQLMNCWEVIKPEVICVNWQYFESLCMMLRSGPCHDLRPFGLYLGQNYFDDVYSSALMPEYCRWSDWAGFRLSLPYT